MAVDFVTDCNFVSFVSAVFGSSAKIEGV